MTNQFHEDLLLELSKGELDELQRKIYDLLKQYPDGISRQNFVFLIYGYVPVQLAGNKHDRKIRKAIEKLRLRLFPIIATSAKPGYRLDFSRQAVSKMLSELQSRRDRIQEQINSAAKFYCIPEYIEPIHATQTRFL